MTFVLNIFNLSFLLVLFLPILFSHHSTHQYNVELGPRGSPEEGVQGRLLDVLLPTLENNAYWPNKLNNWSRLFINMSMAAIIEYAANERAADRRHVQEGFGPAFNNPNLMGPPGQETVKRQTHIDFEGPEYVMTNATGVIFEAGDGDEAIPVQLDEAGRRPEDFAADNIGDPAVRDRVARLHQEQKSHGRYSTDTKESALPSTSSARTAAPHVPQVMSGLSNGIVNVMDKMFDWQLKLFQMCQNHVSNDRTIHYYWEDIGNVGKSKLCYWILNYISHAIVVGSESGNDDILFKVGEYVKLHGRVDVIVIDLPRTAENIFPTRAIESIKNKFWFYGKYKGGDIILAEDNDPIIFIFSNSPPNKDDFSMDRWNIVNITQELACAQQRFCFVISVQTRVYGNCVVLTEEKATALNLKDYSMVEVRVDATDSCVLAHVMTRKNSYNDMSAESLWVSHQLLELLQIVGFDGEGVTLIPKRGCTYNASVHGISSDDESSASEDDEESEDGEDSDGKASDVEQSSPSGAFRRRKRSFDNADAFPNGSPAHEVLDMIQTPVSHAKPFKRSKRSKST